MATLQNYGVVTRDGQRGGILMPKPKHKFRVRVVEFGPRSGQGIDLTRQVVSVDRPTISSSPVMLHSYNSIDYYASKPEWSTINLVVRDDVGNNVSRLVGHQEQKQFNHFQQTTPISGDLYKFDMFIDTLDGSNVEIENWHLEGCFLSNINWDQYSYDNSEPMTISMEIRYTNATQSGDLMTQNPEPSSVDPQRRLAS